MTVAFPSKDTMKKMSPKITNRLTGWIEDHSGFFKYGDCPKKVVFELRDDVSSYVAAKFLTDAFGGSNVFGVVAVTCNDEENHDRLGRIDEICMKTGVTVEQFDLRKATDDMMSRILAEPINNVARSMCASEVRLASVKTLANVLDAKVINTLDLSRINLNDFDVGTDAYGDLLLMSELSDFEIAEFAKFYGFSDELVNSSEFDFYTSTDTYSRTKLSRGDYFQLEFMWNGNAGRDLTDSEKAVVERISTAADQMLDASTWKRRRIRNIPRISLSRVHRANTDKAMSFHGMDNLTVREFYYMVMPDVFYQWY